MTLKEARERAIKALLRAEQRRRDAAEKEAAFLRRLEALE